MASRRNRPAPVQGEQGFWWESLKDEALLEVRLCDLGLTIEGTWLIDEIEQLHHELAGRRLELLPHCWLSNEWFTPTEVPGIAIPFYLAHQRLMRLERKMMLEVEGGSKRECMKILRHEAGHAIQVAYQLHRRRAWQRHFGRSSDPYPETYQPKPYSRRFVMHIDHYYAQAHPDEDFAETFAVWLTPNSQWRKRYRGWGALKKLEYVDALMKEIAGVKPLIRSRRKVDPLSRMRLTLGEHYEERQERYGSEKHDFYLRDLQRLFASDMAVGRTRSAAAFLRRARPEMLRMISRWTGEYQYTINQVYEEMIERCEDAGLRMAAHLDEETVRKELGILLTVQTMNYLHMGGHRLSI